ncbi:MAG: hypothetical protein WEA58_14285 [Balneolaceae bacterium]
MNLGIVTSYIIAGVIILGIVMMNFRVQNSGAELTLSQMNRQYVTDIADMLNDDLSNMGYDVNGRTKIPGTEDIRILDCAQENRIRFYRNLCETDTECAEEDRVPERIEWELRTNEISTSNTNHRTLRRTVTKLDNNDNVVPESEDVTDINIGVTQFNIQYYDSVGSKNDKTGLGCGTNVPSVKQIKVTLEVQSAEKIIQRASDDGRYIRSVWEKRFTPTNLQLLDN